GDLSVLGLTSVSSVRGWNWLSDIIIDNEGSMFVSSWAGDVYKTTDNGITWDSTSNIDTAQTHITDMALYPDNSVLLGTFNNIKKSTDKGISWSTMINGLPNSIIHNIGVTEEGVIYAVSGNKLCRANHIDSSFVIIRDEVVASSPPIYNRIATGSDGIILFADQGTNQGIYRSTDYGETWSKIYNSSVSSLSIYNNKYVVAGLPTGEGILFSSNLGDTWEFLKEGIHSNATISWNIVDSDGYLYASANGLGLYKSNSIVTSTDSQPLPEKISFKLEQNYPNPFNPTTTISYQIKEGGLVKLKVYDILGKEVATLVKEEQPNGNYSVKFDASNLPSGVYMYSLRVNNFSENRKMILLK